MAIPYLIILVLFPSTLHTLSVVRDTSDLIKGMSTCNYRDIRTNVTTDSNGTCGCLLETVMSQNSENFRCATPVDVGCNIALLDGYTIDEHVFEKKTTPVLQSECVRIKAIFVWNLISKESKKGIWIDITEQATKFVSLEPNSNIKVNDIDHVLWEGHVLKVKFGCLDTCSVMKCKQECTILKIKGKIKYPFNFHALAGYTRCFEFMGDTSTAPMIIGLGAMLIILILSNIIFLCCFCFCHKRRRIYSNLEDPEMSSTSSTDVDYMSKTFFHGKVESLFCTSNVPIETVEKQSSVSPWDSQDDGGIYFGTQHQKLQNNPKCVPGDTFRSLDDNYRVKRVISTSSDDAEGLPNKFDEKMREEEDVYVALERNNEFTIDSTSRRTKSKHEDIDSDRDDGISWKENNESHFKSLEDSGRSSRSRKLSFVGEEKLEERIAEHIRSEYNHSRTSENESKRATESNNNDREPNSSSPPGDCLHTLNACEYEMPLYNYHTDLPGEVEGDMRRMERLIPRGPIIASQNFLHSSDDYIGDSDTVADDDCESGKNLDRDTVRNERGKLQRVANENLTNMAVELQGRKIGDSKSEENLIDNDGPQDDTQIDEKEKEIREAYHQLYDERSPRKESYYKTDLLVKMPINDLKNEAIIGNSYKQNINYNGEDYSLESEDREIEKSFFPVHQKHKSHLEGIPNIKGGNIAVDVHPTESDCYTSQNHCNELRGLNTNPFSDFLGNYNQSGEHGKYEHSTEVSRQLGDPPSVDAPIHESLQREDLKDNQYPELKHCQQGMKANLNSYDDANYTATKYFNPDKVLGNDFGCVDRDINSKSRENKEPSNSLQSFQEQLLQQKPLDKGLTFNNVESNLFMSKDRPVNPDRLIGLGQQLELHQSKNNPFLNLTKEQDDDTAKTYQYQQLTIDCDLPQIETLCCTPQNNSLDKESAVNGFEFDQQPNFFDESSSNQMRHSSIIPHEQITVAIDEMNHENKSQFPMMLLGIDENQADINMQVPEKSYEYIYSSSTNPFTSSNVGYLTKASDSKVTHEDTNPCLEISSSQRITNSNSGIDMIGSSNADIVTSNGKSEEMFYCEDESTVSSVYETIKLPSADCDLNDESINPTNYLNSKENDLVVIHTRPFQNQNDDEKTSDQDLFITMPYKSVSQEYSRSLPDCQINGFAFSYENIVSQYTAFSTGIPQRPRSLTDPCLYSDGKNSVFEKERSLSPYITTVVRDDTLHDGNVFNTAKLTDDNALLDGNVFNTAKLTDVGGKKEKLNEVPASQIYQTSGKNLGNFQKYELEERERFTNKPILDKNNLSLISTPKSTTAVIVSTEKGPHSLKLTKRTEEAYGINQSSYWRSFAEFPCNKQQDLNGKGQKNETNYDQLYDHSSAFPKEPIDIFERISFTGVIEDTSDIDTDKSGTNDTYYICRKDSVRQLEARSLTQDFDRESVEYQGNQVNNIIYGITQNHSNNSFQGVNDNYIQNPHATQERFNRNDYKKTRTESTSNSDDQNEHISDHSRAFGDRSISGETSANKAKEVKENVSYTTKLNITVKPKRTKT